VKREDLFPVVYEDGSLLVVHKPADLVCHPTKGDEYSSLISRVRLYLGEASEGQMINRLDRETSGIVMIAKDQETARSLRLQWEARTVLKSYRAIVYGWPKEDAFEVNAALGKDESSAVAIKDCVRTDGHASLTRFRVIEKFERGGAPFTYLEAMPETGRKHQIRIHLQHIGHPIVGDKLYGLDEQYYLDLVYGRLSNEQRNNLLLPHHALHAHSVTLNYQEKTTTFTSHEEPWFTEFRIVTEMCE
jgi:23S rRNA pseudouridine1911/1915/1917 synthase